MLMNKLAKGIFGGVLSAAKEELSTKTCCDVPVLCTDENHAELCAFIIDYCGDDAPMCEAMLAEVVIGNEVFFQDWLLVGYLMHLLEIEE